MNTREQIEQEIQELRNQLAVVIPQEMQTAIELGDLRENGEYAAAIERQYFVGLRLEQLSKRLSAYRNIEISNIPRDEIGIGSIVKTRCIKTKKIVYFKIVPFDIDESDEGKYEQITLNSPIGQALLHKHAQEQVSVISPSGNVVYKILSFQTIHEYES